MEREDYKYLADKTAVGRVLGGENTARLGDDTSRAAQLREDSNERRRRLDIGQAMFHAKRGLRVARKGWNSRQQYVYYVPAASYPAQTAAAREEFGDIVPYREYLALKTAQDDVATWAPSCSDVLANDWYIV